MERFTVSAFKMVNTEAGPIEDQAPARQRTAPTSAESERIAEEWADDGEFSSIYISYIKKGEGACYWNPATGFDPVGRDWNSHILAR